MAQPDGSLVFDTKIITDGFKKGTLALGASVTALAGTVVKLGADFEATAAKASTLFGQVAVDTANLNKKILEISSSTGLAATELNEALYSALSAGIPVTEDMAKATGFLESAAKLAKAGFTDTDTAISATAKTLNAYKLDVSEAERIQGILIQTQNKGITTVNELGASLAQVTPTAAAFSVSFENVGAALATMTAQGTPTAQATTQLNQLIAELGKNGTAAAKNLKAAAQGTSFAGKSFKDMMESGASLSDILMLIQKQAEKNGVSMVDMFSSIEAGKSALAIVSGNAQTFNSNLEAMNDTAGLVEEGYEKMMNTLEGQTDKFIQSAKNLGIGFYEGIKEPLTEAVKAGNDSLSELQEAVANGELKSALTNAGTLIGKFVSVLIKLATSVIPPLVNALGFLGDNIGLCAAAFVILKTSAAITGVITTVTTGIKTMTAGVQGATVAQKLWNAAMSANPIGAVVTGVVALTAGIVALVAAFDNAPEWEKECEEIRSHREELEQTNKEWQEVVKAQKNAEASANSEMNHIQKLSQELRGLADENGNVAESERARAQFILGELNEALGTEYSMNQGRISQYQQLSAEIDNLIAKKRAEALLSSKQEAYDSAVGQIGEKRAILQEETRQYQLAREEVERYTNQIEYLKQKQKELEETKPPDWEYEYDSLTLKIDGLNDELEGANAKLGEHKGAMDAASIAVNDLNTTISDYEGTYENIIKGDYDAVFKGSYKSASGYADGTSAALADGQSDVEATASSIGQDVANAVGDGLKIAVPNTESAMKEFGNQLNKTMSPVIEGARAEGENLILSLAGGVSLKITDAVTVSEDGSQKIIDGLKVSEAVAKQLGIDYIQGVMNGMDSMINPLWNKAFTIMQGMHEYGAKPGVRSNSPAKDGIDLGTDYVLGVEIGLEDEAPELNKTAKETAQDMNKSFADTLSHGMNTIRSEIASITGLIKEEAEKNVKAFDAELKKIEMLRDFGIDDEETYYRKLEFLRDNYLTKNSDKWIDITQELYDYQEAQLKEHKDNIEDVYDDIADHITDKLDEVAKKQQKFSDSLTDSTELFQKYTIDGVVHYKLNDFSSENANLAAYQQWLSKAMERVKSSGASDDAISGVLDYIDGLAGDESGMDALIALASASDADFAKFMSGYAQNLSKADGIAAQRYSDDMVTAAEESYQQMVDELTKAGLDIPEGFFVSGTLSAEQFGEAFLSEIELQMQEIRRKLTEFNAEINASIGAAAGTVTNDNRSTTYHIYGDNSGSTVKQIQNMETIKRLSGQ